MDKKAPPIGTILVVPATDIVLDTFDRLQDYATRPGHNLIGTALKRGTFGTDVGINRHTVAALIAAIYADTLNCQSKWNVGRDETHHFDRQWQKMVDGWERQISTGVSVSLFVDVFRSTYDMIDTRLEDLFDPSESWSVWYTRCHGFDVVIEVGQDFRVIDWERRMALGAEHQKMKDAGESLPAGAWLPDEDSQRFIDLLTTQQTRPSMLGQSSIDKLDAAQSRSGRRKRSSSL